MQASKLLEDRPGLRPSSAVRVLSLRDRSQLALDLLTCSVAVSSAWLMNEPFDGRSICRTPEWHREVSCRQVPTVSGTAGNRRLKEVAVARKTVDAGATLVAECGALRK